MRPALWRSARTAPDLSDQPADQRPGPRPGRGGDRLVPDLDHFRGSFGARAVIPLWCDALATQPNVARDWLARLSDRYGQCIDAEELLAYCYAVLGTPTYVSRFAQELRTPGPRLPLPGDGAVFARAATLGKHLLWLHTFGERCVPPGLSARNRSEGQTRCLSAPAGRRRRKWCTTQLVSS